MHDVHGVLDTHYNPPPPPPPPVEEQRETTPYVTIVTPSLLAPSRPPLPVEPVEVEEEEEAPLQSSNPIGVSPVIMEYKLAYIPYATMQLVNWLVSYKLLSGFCTIAV